MVIGPACSLPDNALENLNSTLEQSVTVDPNFRLILARNTLNATPTTIHLITNKVIDKHHVIYYYYNGLKI
jgi:hypothetical protein